MEDCSDSRSGEEANSGSPGCGRSEFVVALLLLILSLVTFHGILERPLDSDAQFLTVRNSFMRDFAGLREIWRSDFFAGAETQSGQPYESGYYRPVTNTVFWLESRIGGDRPYVHNLFQLLAHWLASLGVFWTGIVVLRDKRAALLAAFVFVVHPINAFVASEPKARSDALVGIFYLAALVSYWKSQQSTRVDARLLGISSFFFVLALLSKEMAVTFVGVAALASIALHFRHAYGWSRILYCLPAAGTLGLYAATRIFAIGLMPHSDVGYGSEYSTLTLILNMTKNLSIYIARLFLPVGSEFADLLPGLVNFVNPLSADPLLWASLALIGLLVWIAWSLREKEPEYAFLILFFLATAAPLFAVRNIGGTISPDRILTHSRWIYLPIVAPILLLSSLASRFFASWAVSQPRRIGICALAVVVLAGLARSSAIHARESDTQLALVKQYALLPEDRLGRFERTNILLLTASTLHMPRREYAAAEELCRKAVALAPDSPIPAVALARVLMRIGRFAEAATIIRPWFEASPTFLQEKAKSNLRVTDDMNRMSGDIAAILVSAVAEESQDPRSALSALCAARRRGLAEDRTRGLLVHIWRLHGAPGCRESEDRARCWESSREMTAPGWNLDPARCDAWALRWSRNRDSA